MKKGLIITLLFAAMASVALACPVCERQQPKVLRGVVHGSSPESSWDYVIVAVVAVITVFTLYYSVKWLIRPGETNKEHIKYHILNNE
jgi:phage shock protein PspC (stress-responsive transcriptional regulator)